MTDSVTNAGRAAAASLGDGKLGHPRKSLEEQHAISMRELGKLTADQVDQLDHPVPVTSNGLPVAWLVPLEPSERRRAEMVASGRLKPRRRDGLTDWTPLPPTDAGPPLSEVLTQMRAQERS